MHDYWTLMKKLIWLRILQGASFIVNKITGTSPITLTNAINSAIISLKQYGKCVQDGTPTPDAFVDIKCNNGVLTMVDDELPSGYKRITSIKFDGDFWYELGEALTGDDDVTMTLANTATSGQNVFGSYNGTASGTKNFSLYIYGGGSTSSSYFRYGEQLVRPKFGSGERTITFGKSGTSGFQTDVTVTPEEFTTPANAYIGMLPNSSSPAYTGSIIGNVLVGTRLKYIPCEREYDGVIGYYEAVNGAFFEPIGTGTPVAGSYDTSHLNKLVVVGTPEVLTVSASGAETQTVTNIPNLFSTLDGSVMDDVDFVSGVVTRRTEAVYEDGGIVVKALAEPVTEQTMPHSLYTVEGTNVVEVTSNIDLVTLEVEYKENR